uniref:cytochrome c oxidase subunit II n=1 Tax=Intoshia linei TaxID=1819745 RepID=UPI001EDDC103|nr:cytochrome c oxidase subunit II [Intoshia linei]UIB41618.1 cytochrome c oxidase subunit 2 [Intoshia linei]
MNMFNSNMVMKHMITLIFIYTLMFFMIFCIMLFSYMYFNKMFYVLKNKEHMMIELCSFFLPLFLVMYLNFILIESCITEMLSSINSNPIIIKIIGNQWFWTYEYDLFNSVFNSYMISNEEIKSGMMRNLEVDNRMVLPYNKMCSLMITSSDVIHSFSIPGLGIKMDAIPGRLNNSMIFSKLPGVFYGQCSELCGIDHSFMPICLEFISSEHFNKLNN